MIVKVCNDNKNWDVIHFTMMLTFTYQFTYVNANFINIDSIRSNRCVDTQFSVLNQRWDKVSNNVPSWKWRPTLR